MPLEQVRFILESVHEWCDGRRIPFGAFPMHEVAAHPDAAALIRLFATHDRMPNPFQPLTTTGVPLATRDDWRDVIEAARKTGTTVVWMAVHGLAERHDQRVRRSGAFAETCTAIERVHSAGMAVGCNVFVTADNVQDAHRIAQILNDLGVEEQSWQPADYYPHARARRNEWRRPTLEQLLPVASAISGWCNLHRERWSDIAAWTEEAWVRRALTDQWPDSKSDLDFGALLVLRPNLDLHFGRAGDYGERFGNLARDGLDEVLRRVMSGADRSADEIWFRPDELLPIADAARHGSAAGTAIHFSANSVRYLWLDRARGVRL